MDVVSACPLRVASLVWQARPGTWVLTLVCKATYRLAPDLSPLAAEQEDPSEDDNHWDDDAGKSVYVPSDLVPFKTRADVLLVGYAFAPSSARVPSFVARMIVGEIDKAIAVYGDRAWTLDGRVRELAPLTRVPLRYERAAGGPDSANPVGMRPDAANALGEIPIPNLWPPGRTPRQRGEIVEPIAFGPIASTWPSRREKLGALARSFSVRALTQSALPLDVDPGFFSAAPRDQQLAELHADERIVLEHLHPVHSRLVTNLPGIAPRAFVERRNTSPQELSVRPDTLWIDTNRQIATMTWRGQLPLVSAEEPGRVLVGMAAAGARIGWSDVVAQAERAAGQRGAPLAAEVDEAESLSEEDVRDAGDSVVLSGAAAAAGAMRGFAPQAPVSGPQASLSGPQASLSGPQGPAPGGSSEDASSTLFLMGAPDAAQTLPFALTQDGGGMDALRRAEQQAAANRGPGALPQAWTPPDATATAMFPPAAPPTPMFLPGAPPTAVLPPTAMLPPTAVLPPAASQPAGPAAALHPGPAPLHPGAAAPPHPAPQMALQPLMPLPPVPPPPVQGALEPPSFVRTPLLRDEAPPRPEAAREVAIAGSLARATDAGRDAAGMGVLGLSDAAADAHRVVERDRHAGDPPVPEKQEKGAFEARSRPSEILKLLWFDPKVVPRLHRHPEWRILLAEMELRLLDERMDDEEDGSGGGGGDAAQADTKARRSVFEVLSRGLPSPPDSLRRALSEAVDERGMFEPPLVLLSGELEFAFDEVETLKAAVTVLTPLGAIPENKTLREALEAAQELLKIPGADQFGRLAENLTQRLRDAFTQARKTLPADYVDANLERALLRQRAYAMKTLYGKRWIRALLRGAGGGAGAGGSSGVGGGGRGDGGGRGGDGGGRGDGRSGEAAPPVYLPEPLKDALPAYKRVRVKALGEVDLQEDQEEAASWVVKVAALARVVPGL